jgi:hypothetical protein
VYLLTVVLLMALFPIGSIFAELLLFRIPSDPLLLVGKWFVFWAVGVRQLLAGLRQAIRPELTAGRIFGIRSREPFVIVQELGFANISMGTLGVASIAYGALVQASAIVSGLFFGIAGVRHLLRREQTSAQVVATVSDLSLSVVLMTYLVYYQVRR